MNLYISTKNQVLDEDSEFGGVTGWCRALLAVKCFSHQVMVDNDHGVIVAILNFAALNLDLGQPVKSCEMLSALRDDV